MIKSMTGFGRGKHQIEGIDILIEIKTFNHRYCDFYVKLPRQISFLEDKIREYAGGYISRGKAEIYVTYYEKQTESANIYLDSALAKSYINALRNLKNEFELKDEVSLSLVSRFPDIIKVISNEPDETKLWDTLKIPLNEALKSLVSMREYEGKKLSENVLDRLNCINEYLTRITARAPEIPIEYAQKFKARIDELLNQKVVDETRMATEIAIFADKCNIDEEIERLNAHVAQFSSLVVSKEAVGRKLDFLVQEMNREINTIGSKANDLAIIKDVVDVKSEIEKIREQIQNIE